MRLNDAVMFDQQVDRLSIVEVIMKLAVRANSGESPTIDQSLFPESPQTAKRYVFIPTDESRQLRCRRKPIAQYCFDDVEISIGDDADGWSIRSDEF